MNGSISTFCKLIHSECVAELSTELADDRRNDWSKVAVANPPLFPVLRRQTCMVREGQVLGLKSVMGSRVGRHHGWSAQDDDLVVDCSAHACGPRQLRCCEVLDPGIRVGLGLSLGGCHARQPSRALPCPKGSKVPFWRGAGRAAPRPLPTVMVECRQHSRPWPRRSTVMWLWPNRFNQVWRL